MTIELILTLPTDTAPSDIQQDRIAVEVADLLGLDSDEIEVDWQEVEE